MSHRTWTLSAVAVTAAASLAIPAAASAVTGTLNQACYTHVPTRGSQPIVVSLTGGTPGAGYVVSASVPGKGLGTAGSADGNFDAAGNATAEITDVSPPSGTIDPTRGQRIDVSVQDFGVTGFPVVPIGQTLVTTLSMNVSDRPTNPRAHRLVRVSGAPYARRRVYGFITRTRSNHVLRRIALGRGDVCGFVSAKAIVAPPGYRAGTYRLYVNAGKKLDKRNALWSSFRIYRRAF
ncbi:MAG: hypothetical protein ACRDPM_19290 [Solirubrobacteraceae bacterium]